MNQVKIWDSLYKANLRWKMEARNIPGVLKGKRVLELGVGNGKTLRSIIKQKVKEVIVVDFSEQALKSLDKDFSQIEKVKANITSLPFEDGKFDAVVCYFTLNNLLNKEREISMKEIYRVLKKSGILLFQDFSAGDFRQKDGKRVEDNTIEKKNGLICHFFSDEELRILLEKFKSTKIELLVSNPIKSNRNLKRKILWAYAKK